MEEFLPESETVRGGLDRYLGPTAESGSNLPLDLTPNTLSAADGSEPDTSDVLNELANAERQKEDGTSEPSGSRDHLGVEG